MGLLRNATLGQTARSGLVTVLGAGGSPATSYSILTYTICLAKMQARLMHDMPGA